jgi:hypothetical protein
LSGNRRRTAWIHLHIASSPHVAPGPIDPNAGPYSGIFFTLNRPGFSGGSFI